MTTRFAPRNLQGLPTLTEVIDLPVLQPIVEDAATVATDLASPPQEPLAEAQAPQPAVPAATLDVDGVVSEVYEALRREAEPMLDVRLREAIEPAVERVVQGLVVELRAELAATLRDLVERAVGDVLARRGEPPG
ncbi:MAG TPA: hypothetical protein PL196_01505 [Burkholderiaceae bacterium]|nr:hypothetical protein [Burkholderiaceae bacterium]